MIAKVVRQRGKTVAGLVAYLFGPGRSDEHQDQRVIAADEVLRVPDGLLLDGPEHQGQVRELAQAMDDHRRALGIAPDGGWVYHCALSLPPGEHLDDAQWAQIAREAATALGFTQGPNRAPCRWVAVAHGKSAGRPDQPDGKRGSEHIHLAVNLVREDGSIATPGGGRDWVILSRLCAQWERRYGLHVVEGRTGRGLPGYTRAEQQRATARAAAAGHSAAEAVPEHVLVARKIRSAATATSEAEFLRAVAADPDLLIRPRYAKGGTSHVVGYSAALRGHGKPVFYGGGRLAADLALPKLRAHWADSPADSTPAEALAEWHRTTGGPGRVDEPGVDEQRAARRAPVRPDADHRGVVQDWERAAELVTQATDRLRTIAHTDTAAWAAAAADTAALLAALAPIWEPDGHGLLSAAADALSWSAQGGDRPAGRDVLGDGLRQAARIVRAADYATRRTASGPDALAVAVAAAVVVLAVLTIVALITAYHAARSQPRHADRLHHLQRRCTGRARTHLAGTAPPWQRRPHGARTDPELRSLERQYAADHRRLAAVEGTADTYRQQARDGHGPAAAALHQRARLMAAAAAAEQQLPAARDAISSAEQQIRQARADLARWQQQAGRGRIALRLDGTTRDQAAAGAAQAQQHLNAALHAERAARDTVRELAATAAAPFPVVRGRTTWTEGAATAEHTDLATRWQQHLAAAISEDLATAPARARDDNGGRAAAAVALAGYRTEPPKTADHAATLLAGVRTELALRQALPAAVTRAEHAARTRQQPTTQRPRQSTHRPYRPPPRRGGPGHGLGR